MQAKKQRNPFTPGSGITPPILAGRSSEQSTLREHLDMLCSSDGPHAPMHVLISGPRGVGKTVLLNWVEKEFTDKFKNGAVIRTSSRNIRTMTELVSVLDKDVIDASILHGWHAGGSIVTGSGEYGKTPVPHIVTPPWAHLLEQSLLSKYTVPEGGTTNDIAPLLVTIDEAHNLTGEAVVAIANLAQACSRSKAQACFMLAGTPGLLNHLVSSGPKNPDTGEYETATFVERCDKIYPGLLDRRASKEALLTPFQNNHWRLDDAVMDEILDDAQDYPWFLQLWGKGLWSKGTDNREINRPVMEAASDKVNRERTTIYQARLKEINRPLNPQVSAGAVLSAASRIAEYFLSTDCETISGLEFRRVLASLDEQGISSNDHEDIKTRLLNAGFIVERPTRKRMHWAVGIPSLAGFIVDSMQEYDDDLSVERA